MTPEPSCPACGRYIDALTRTAGRPSPDADTQPDVNRAEPCGCRLTPEQADHTRTELVERRSRP